MIKSGNTILKKLQNGEFKLRKSEQKVANWIVDNVDHITTLSITIIAQKTGVSQPTIVRFCRALGCKGYQDFKIRFAEGLAIGKVNQSIDIQLEDNAATVKDKVAQFARAALADIDREIDTQALEHATEIIIDAKKILICGFGASNCAAFDSFHKFFRIMHKVGYYPDMHMSAMAVGSLQPNDAIIAISNSGKSKALVRLCKLARTNGAKVISITDPGSAVDQVASVSLNIERQVDTGLFVPMAHRLKQLTIIDFLVYNYVRLNPEISKVRLQKTKTALIDLKSQHSLI